MNFWNALYSLGLGCVYAPLGLPEQANNCLRQAQNLFHEQDQILFEAISLIALSASNTPHLSRPENRQIITESYEKYRKIFDGLENKKLAKSFLEYYNFMMEQRGGADYLNNLGNAYSLRGKLQSPFYEESHQEARQIVEFYEQAKHIYKEIRDVFGEAQSLNNLGHIYFSVGRYQQSIEFYDQAKIKFESLKKYYHLAFCFNHLGTAYLSLGQTKQQRDDYEQAKNYYEQARGLFLELGKQSEAAIAQSKLGFTCFSLGQHQEGIDLIHQSLEVLRQPDTRNDLGEAACLSYLGFTDLFSERYQQAIDAFKQSLSIVRRIQSPLGETFALAALGLALFKSGNLPEAEKMLQESVEMRETLRREFNDPNQISFSDVQVDTYGILQQVLIAQNREKTALEIAERGRARAFINLLALRLSSEEIAHTYVESPNITQIQQIARQNNVTLVEYSIIYNWVLEPELKRRESSLLIWVIKPTGEIFFRSLELFNRENNSSLEQLVNQARNSIKNKDADSPYLPQLHQILIQPIAEFLPNNLEDLVVFIPQGCLFLMPFSALQDENGEFLIQQYTTLIVPSIQVLEFNRQPQEENTENSHNALVVGNPTMPSEKLDSLPALPAAQAQANLIAALLNTEAIIGANATKVNIVEQMPKARLIHFATHGILDDIGPKLDVPGAIALAPSGDDNDWLTAGEIYNHSLKAELMTLSACRTGEGTISSDGVIGLSRCSMLAGVPRLIVSLWEVDELATALLMIDFYKRIQNTLPLQLGDVSKALNQAQRWLLTLSSQEAQQKLEELDINEALKHIYPEAPEVADSYIRKYPRNIALRAPYPFAQPFYWSAFITIGL